MTAHRHDWMMSDRSDVLECADCGACCTWDPSDRSTHPDANQPGERRPCAGWVDDGHGRHALGRLSCPVATVDEYDDGSVTCTIALRVGDYVRDASISVPSNVASAKLAAEDALRAIAAEILRAVGA